VASDDESSSMTRDAIHKAINWTQVVLLVLVLGFGWMILQLNGLPESIASLVPASDFSGEQADGAVGPIQEQLVSIEAKVDDLTVRLARVCAIVEADRPAASPEACSSPSQ
jgi:hypothetical protein